MTYDYKFTIDIQSVDVKSEDRTVTVIILENQEVVFKKTPHIVSKMNNLIHQIVLSPDGKFWKIIDDTYDDYLWRAIRQTSIEFIESQINTPQWIPFASYPAIQQNKVGSGGYDRSNAVQFANAWTFAQAFYDFVVDGHWRVNGPEGVVTII